MLTIRLSRVGKKKQPSYRLIISEKARDPWGKALEILGGYNPRTKAAALKADRITYWIGKGATVSDSAWNLLLTQKVVEGKLRNVVDRTKSNPPKKSAEGGSASGGEEAPAA